MEITKYSYIILCKTLLKGGAEKQALILAKLLTESNTAITLVNWCGNKVDDENHAFIIKNSIQYIGLQGSALKKFVQLLKLTRTEEFYILLSFLTLANSVAGICRLLNKSVVSIGGIRTEKLPFYKFFFERLVHNRFNNATVFNNYSAREKFSRNGFKPAKITVIHNAINVPQFGGYKREKDEVSLVSVSRFIKPKDLETALHSFKQLVERNKDKKLKYYLIGYGPLEGHIRLLVSKLNLGHHVVILINPPNIQEIIKDCDIYLSTSLYEGLSNSIMEAMASGLPVVATDVGDNRYLIKDSYNGYIVPCRDINTIVEKLDYLVHSENIRNEFGANSYLKIRDEFSEEHLLGNYMKLFSKLVASEHENK